MRTAGPSSTRPRPRSGSRAGGRPATARPARRAPGRRGHGRRRPLGLLLTAIAVLGAGGGGGAGCARDAAVLELADFVDHQRHRVATEVVSVADGHNLERLGYGWRLVADGGSSARAAEIDRRSARVELLAPGGDLAGVVIEGAVAEGEGRPRLAARLNGERLGRRLLSPGRQEIRFDVPAELVEDGANRLELLLGPPRARASGERPSRLRITRLRFPAASGRPPRLAGPHELEVVETRRWLRRRREIRMPVPSGLEVTLHVPAAARLEAEVALEAPGEPGGASADGYGGDRGSAATAATASGPPPRPTRFTVRLESAGGTVELAERTLDGGEPVELDLDLAPWTGELATVTLEVAGDRSGVVRVAAARIAGESAAGPPPSLPAAPLAPPASGRLGRPDVVLILLDAARADAFSPYGSPSPTPALDRLAREGTLFERARSPSAWTGQSVPATLTGFYPDSLGIEHWGSRLGDGVPTLAELAAAAGYRTVLWSQHPLYKARPDLRRGFETWHIGDQERRDELAAIELLVEAPAGAQEPPDADTGSASPVPGSGPGSAGSPGQPDGAGVAGAGGDDRPVLALVHLLPPHTPYEPPQEFRGAVAPAGEPLLDVGAPFLNRFPQRESPTGLAPEELDYVRARYQENALFADALVGRVLELLEHRGRYDGALVAIFSDHGEAFLEHGFFLHGRHLWHEYVDVPWIVKWPAGAGGARDGEGARFAQRVAEPVSLVDLVPTLVDGLGLGPRPGAGPPAFQGRSLLPAVFDDAETRRPVYLYTRGIAHGNRPPKPKIALEHGRLKLVRNLEAGELLLYDRETDPAEARDLAADRPLLARFLDQALGMQRTLNLRLRDSLASDSETGELDADTIEKLRALGYLQ